MRLRSVPFALSMSLVAAPALAAPKVVASIQPIHSLVTGVMEGVAEPRLLVPAGASPHGYQMRPSDAAALQDADLVVWVGEGMETFLDKPIASLADSGKALELMEAPGLTLLESREGGAWDSHDDGEEAEEADAHDHEHGHDEGDPHIWLSPANAKAIVAAVATALSEADAANAATYAGNAEKLAARLDQLQGDLSAQLQPVRGKPFIVFHDSFQYFEKAFGLDGVGSITVSPDRPPSARRLAELRQRITEHGAACVFSEPQTRTQLVATLVEGTRIGAGQLDPEGSAALPQGTEAYFALMQGNARALVDCLSKAS